MKLSVPRLLDREHDLRYKPVREGQDVANNGEEIHRQAGFLGPDDASGVEINGAPRGHLKEDPKERADGVQTCDWIIAGGHQH
jgi:hypothetical protein